MSIRRNTVLNLAGAIIPMVVMLATIPLYLKLLGEARYGVLALIWLVLGYFSFLEMGLGKATANQMAKAENAQEAERSDIFWTALLVNCCAGVAGAGILWGIGDYLVTSVLNVPEDFRREAISALPWMVATFPVAVVSSVLNGALEGRNRFLTVNVLQISSNTIFQIVPLAVAYWIGPSLSEVIPAAVVSRALMNVLFLEACHRNVPLVTMPNISIARAKTLFSYSWWVAVTGTVTTLLETIERFVVGAVLGPAAVTYYTVPMQLVGKIKVLPGSLARALFPAFSARSSADAAILAIDATKALATVMALVAIISALALRPFLTIWVGEDISNTSAPIGELLLFGVWINSVAHVPYFFLQASGRPDLVARIHALEFVPYVLLTWSLITRFGLFGAVAIWICRCVVEALALFFMARFPKNLLMHLAVTGSAVFGVIIALLCFSHLNMFWRAVAMLPCIGAGIRIAIRNAAAYKLRQESGR